MNENIAGVEKEKADVEGIIKKGKTQTKNGSRKLDHSSFFLSIR